MKTPLLSLVLLLGLASPLFSQWTMIYQTDSLGSTSQRWSIFGMSFFGRDSGIICDKGIAYTVDGGKTWTKNVWDSTIVHDRSWAFTDINHLRLNLSGYNYYMYSSSNAGFSWSKDSIDHPLNNTITCIHFQDSMVGWAGADGLTIFKTTNGGKSWILTHGPEREDGPNYYMEKIAFSTPNLGLAASGNFGTWILRTTDGGSTWVNLTNGSANLVSFSPTGLSFPDPMHAFFSTRSRLYSSRDGGLSWEEVKTIIPFGNDFRSISFVDSVHGIAAGIEDSQLIVGYTSNGGITWRRWSMDTRTDLYPRTAFPDLKVAYVAGREEVYRLNIDELAVELEDLSESSVKLYNDALTITLSADYRGIIRVIDMLGRTIDERNFTQSDVLTLDIRDWPKQIFVQVLSRNRMKVFKVLH